MLIEATAASLTESFFPKDLAFKERCENDVLSASNKLTTMLMNCNESERKCFVFVKNYCGNI